MNPDDYRPCLGVVEPVDVGTDLQRAGGLVDVGRPGDLRRPVGTHGSGGEA
jgi:hypothetical protein